MGVFVWIYSAMAQPMTELPGLLSSSGLNLTGEVSLGQIGVVIAIVWTAAKVFFPLLAKIDNVKIACDSNAKAIASVRDVQIVQGGMIQRVIGQLEGEQRLRQFPSPFRGGDIPGA